MTLLAVNVALSDWRQLVFVIIGSNAEKIARPPHPVHISLKNHKNQRLTAQWWWTQSAANPSLVGWQAFTGNLQGRSAHLVADSDLPGCIDGLYQPLGLQIPCTQEQGIFLSFAGKQTTSSGNALRRIRRSRLAVVCIGKPFGRRNWAYARPRSDVSVLLLQTNREHHSLQSCDTNRTASAVMAPLSLCRRVHDDHRLIPRSSRV
jgi:hypothetical protein